jgi:hypothetical protein
MPAKVWEGLYVGQVSGWLEGKGVVVEGGDGEWSILLYDVFAERWEARGVGVVRADGGDGGE